MRATKLLALGLAAASIVFGACSINPQPLPPEGAASAGPPDDGTGGHFVGEDGGAFDSGTRSKEDSGNGGTGNDSGGGGDGGTTIGGDDAGGDGGPGGEAGPADAGDAGDAAPPTDAGDAGDSSSDDAGD